MVKQFGLVAMAALVFTGCTYKDITTPAAMTYDGSKVDYSKIDQFKHATVCKSMKDLDGDTTVIAAAKKAQISNIMHVDTSVETSKFLVFITDMKRCVTVYGQ